MIFDSLINLEKYSTIPYLEDICIFIKNNNVFVSKCEKEAKNGKESKQLSFQKTEEETKK